MDGVSKRYLYTRETPTIKAGSRFSTLPEKIPFGYKELTEALTLAIEKSGQEGATIVDKPNYESVLKDRPFEEIQEEAKTLWTELVERNPDNANKVLEAVHKVFGERKKLSEIPESQKDMFELLLIEMRAM